VKFENASFNKDDMVRPDLFRTADRSQWISPRGFEAAAKHNSLSVAPKGQLSDCGSNFDLTGTSIDSPSLVEPFKDPNSVPDFVRTTQGYLKEKSKLQTLKRLKDIETEINNMVNKKTPEKLRPIEPHGATLGASSLSFMSNNKIRPSELGEISEQKI
jgi:hypothetical protein